MPPLDPTAPTDEEIWVLLRRLDDPEHIETPAGFDYRAAGARFQALKDGLEASFGGAADADGWENVQDASHFGRLIVPNQLTASNERLVVTVSNFSPLVSVALENPGVHDRTELAALLNERDEHRLARSLQAIEHVVVPEELLCNAYDGTVELLRGGNWWVRYFDYL